MILPKNRFLFENYNSFYEYREAVQRWSLDHTLLSRGGFYGYISLLDFGKVQVVNTGLSGTIDHKGSTPPGYRTFMIPARINQTSFWYNREVEQEPLSVFPRNGEIDSITYANHGFTTISIEENHLEYLMRDCNAIHLLKTLTNDKSTFPLNKQFLFYINSFIHLLFNRINEKPELVNSTAFIHSVTYKLPMMLINFMDRGEIIVTPEINKKRDRAFKTSVEYISKNIKRNISVKELSQVSSVSVRSLELAFNERYGISPKSFIKSARLNKVKQEIHRSRGNRKISEIAEDYGFYHLGQLSSDYRKQFSELPKQTRNASKA